MKAYQRLLLIVLGALLFSCLLTPLVVFFLHALSKSLPNLGSAIIFPFDRVMSRVVLVMVLVLLYIERHRFEIRTLASMGLRRSPGWERIFWRGWILGVCSLSLMLFIMFLLGSRRLKAGFTGPWDLSYQIINAFLTGLIVALLEETFFRGFILQNLMKDMRRGSAILATSVFFAIVHFFKAEGIFEPSGFAPLAGFKVLTYFFQPLLNPI